MLSTEQREEKPVDVHVAFEHDLANAKKEPNRLAHPTTTGDQPDVCAEGNLTCAC
jgi:hypothetical protein